MDKKDTEEVLMRDFLSASPSQVIISNPNNYTYSTEDREKIRTCKECKISEQFMPDASDWVLLMTRERVEWVCEQMDNGSDWMECKLCSMGGR